MSGSSSSAFSNVSEASTPSIGAGSLESNERSVLKQRYVLEYFIKDIEFGFRLVPLSLNDLGEEEELCCEIEETGVIPIWGPLATPLLLGPATKTIMDLFMNKYPIRPTRDTLDLDGKYSSCLMRDTVKTLADMQKLPDKIFFFKEGKLLLKMVVEKCGLDAIMAIIPQEHVEVMELLAEAKRRAEKAISGGLVGAAKMTKKPKL
ncbi:hypothetical protein ACLB2K_000754 [Fragaria x ananassa]